MNPIELVGCAHALATESERKLEHALDVLARAQWCAAELLEQYEAMLDLCERATRLLIASDVDESIVRRIEFEEYELRIKKIRAARLLREERARTKVSKETLMASTSIVERQKEAA